MNQIQPNGTQMYTPDPKKQENTPALVSLICGIAGFVINPLYLVSLTAFIAGIVGIVGAKGRPKGKAVAGMLLACSAFAVQLVVDFILAFFTFGLSFFI